MADMTAGEFWTYVFNRDQAPTHIRVPNQRQLGVFLVGLAVDLHGPTGCCTCCPRGGDDECRT